MAKRVAWWLALPVLAACGPHVDPLPAADLAPRPVLAPDVVPAAFSVRERWPDPRDITVWLEAGTAPIGDEAFGRAVERAMAAWNVQDGVRLRRVAEAAGADVQIGWRRGRHGRCAAFGPGADVAHTGPSAPGTFVHFDLGRSWSEAGPAMPSVFHTALHELGHVLGLGHAAVADAVMSTDLQRPEAPSRHDLLGLRSLYGGAGAAGSASGDVSLVDAGGSARTTLFGIAPPAVCDLAAFDCDGDRRQELLVWRTDTAGHGALTIYFLDAAGRLTQTLGPFYGAVMPGARVGLATIGGCRYLGSTPPGPVPGATSVREFGAIGVPAMPREAPPADLGARLAVALDVDLDGDGTFDAHWSRGER